MINKNNFKIDLEKLKNILINLNTEEEKLTIFINNIEKNYQEFKNYNMAGQVNKETINDYEYGLKQSKQILSNLDNMIQTFSKIYNEYLNMSNEITKSVGEKNGL